MSNKPFLLVTLLVLVTPGFLLLSYTANEKLGLKETFFKASNEDYNCTKCCLLWGCREHKIGWYYADVRTEPGLSSSATQASLDPCASSPAKRAKSHSGSSYDWTVFMLIR